jgi:hypothetical protein
VDLVARLGEEDELLLVGLQHVGYDQRHAVVLQRSRRLLGEDLCVGLKLWSHHARTPHAHKDQELCQPL